jgi:hypothetical protein
MLIGNGMWVRKWSDRMNRQRKWGGDKRDMHEKQEIVYFLRTYARQSMKEEKEKKAVIPQHKNIIPDPQCSTKKKRKGQLSHRT